MCLCSMSLGPEAGSTKAFCAPMKGLAINGFGSRFTTRRTFESPSSTIIALTIETAIAGLMFVGATSIARSVVARRRRRRLGMVAI